jgi:hypothetical protein
MFKEWENDKGGFRVKWVDDVNALIVFADAAVGECSAPRSGAVIPSSCTRSFLVGRLCVQAHC